MDLEEFNYLSLEEKTLTLMNNGTLLGIRLEGNHSLALYHTDKFFAEAWYNPVTNMIEKINGFTDLNLLEPYLKLIQLPRLY